MTRKNEKATGLFPPLLKYWRGSKGLSQLDLGLAADVSARHISFLETGRAKPSREMVLALASTLQIPLREQNTLLTAAGFEPEFDEPVLGAGTDKPVEKIVRYMLEKHEPYPMLVMNWGYDMVNSNITAQKLLQRFIANPSAIAAPLNLYDLMFHPELARPFIKDWNNFAHSLLARLHRESLLKSYDTRLSELIERLLNYPGVPEEWRVPDFSISSEACSTFQLQNEEMQLSFISTITTFSVPQNITAQEILIETLFPLDDRTEQACIEIGNT